jgi:hypothetical protein
MRRISPCLVAAVMIVAGALNDASAQSTNSAPAATSAPAASSAPAAKPSRLKLTAAKLKEMKAKWLANRPKLKACRKEVRAKGLVGDERWFYIEDCMEKT